MLFGGSSEGGDHGRGGDRLVGGHREGQAGAVIQPGQDLAGRAVCEAVVGDVGLPAFVGQRGFEADVGRFRALLRLRGDEAGPFQGAPDRRRRHDRVVVVVQVPGDGVGAGVETFPRELLAQLHDQLNSGRRDRVRGGAGAAGARLQRRVAVDAPAGHEFRDPSG